MTEYSTDALPYLIQGENIIVIIDNINHTIGKAHVSYGKIRDSIRDLDWASVREFVDPVKRIINYGQGRVKIVDEQVFWDGEEMHNTLSSRMVEMLREGFSIDAMVKFMDNLMLNPSFRSVNELYGFLERNNLPITPDGCFLAYKRVREDYTDVHSGKNDNSVGETVMMDRNKVNDNKDQTCSPGLHFCSKEYLSSFGGSRIMIVKINPADVVSIPTDYGFSKGRCCKYQVTGELGIKPELAFTKTVQENANTHEDNIFTPDWLDDPRYR